MYVFQSWDDAFSLGTVSVTEDGVILAADGENHLNVPDETREEIKAENAQ